LAWLSHPDHIFSRKSDGRCETSEECQSDINQAESKLKELASEKDTLSNQIKYLNSQVELTRLKITQTETSIKQLEGDIANLTLKIDKLDVYLNYLSHILIGQINESYKLNKRLPPLPFLTTNFNQFLSNYKYLQVLQKNNHDTLIDMETARINFDLQKQEKNRKQTELTQMQKRLDDQKKNLLSQKSSKDHLLQITKNDEAKYQKLKKEAESELSALLNAKFVGKREVKKGEALGIMGNTGYSFGDHLHFGLYQIKEEDQSKWSYYNDIDPNDYLSQHRWPMDPTLEITQGRGQTPYSYLYKDRFHHGIDMVSTNTTIKAVNDGTAYFYRGSSSFGNHVRLFHPDGKMTLYLHMK
jgi:peptidoglycan hydrolase CwlO-like protein